VVQRPATPLANCGQPKLSDSRQGNKAPHVGHDASVFADQHIAASKMPVPDQTRYPRCCGDNYIYYVRSISFIKSTNWPVGAMVARSPPKAEAVGSSPTSVAFNDLVLRIILFAFLLTLQNRLDGVDMNFCMIWWGICGPSFQNIH
jgi:hypothetical protein